MGWSERISASRLFTTIALFGCLTGSGCSSADKLSHSASGSGSAVSAKPLPPLSVDRVMSIPGSWRQEDIFVKPGHWSAAWVEAAANADDFQGDLEIRLEDGAQSGPGPLDGPAMRRPLVLPKGEPRAVEGAY